MKDQDHCVRFSHSANSARTLAYASALTAIVLPLFAPLAFASRAHATSHASAALVKWQPYACGDSLANFVTFRGVSLSVSEEDQQEAAGAFVKISPATKINSMTFGLFGYTTLRITLTGDKGTALAVVDNGSNQHFKSYTLTPKDFTGNAGNVSTVKIRFINNSNFGSVPNYMRNLQVNGTYANAVLKSFGCIPE